MGIKDWIIRKIAKSFLLKWADGYKSTIFRIVQVINVSLVSAFLLCPHLPEIQGHVACDLVDQLNGGWLALSTALGQLGLEFGIQDAKAKARLKEEGRPL